MRRSNLYHDTFRSFSKPTFNVNEMLKVCFIGEPGTVDDGVPRHEFFSLLIREIFRMSGLFLGWPEHAVPVHNVQAVANNNFYLVGKMLATCLVQGENHLCALRKLLLTTSYLIRFKVLLVLMIFLTMTSGSFC